MADFQSELIGFTIVTIVVFMLAYLTSRMEKRFKEQNKNDENEKD